MPDRAQLERLFVDNLPVIDRAIGTLCRRYGVARDETEDVASWVKARLIESDYAALARFRGESSLITYLHVVVAMYFRDFRAQKWGRWRPSAAALRHGEVAVRLETLVVRDHVPLRQAGEMMRSAGETALSDVELSRLLATLPAREALRPVEVGADALAASEAADRADARLWSEVSDRERRGVTQQLDEALAQLTPEDRVALRLRYWEDLSVADTARVLGVEQKPLYRRLERALRELRSRLEAMGVSDSVLDFLREHDGMEAGR